MPNMFTKKERVTSKFKNHKTPYDTKKAVSETQNHSNTHTHAHTHTHIHTTINISNIKEG